MKGKTEEEMASELANLYVLVISLNGLVDLILDRLKRLQNPAKSTD